MRFLKSLLLSSFLTPISWSATIEVSAGVHDFIVNGIDNPQKQPSYIESGTSHTLGLNTAVWIQHKTPSGISFTGKAQVLLDRDKDELDKDHLPVWFDFLLDIDGEIYKPNDTNSFKWYIYLDNKQNTVSCIERQVRQHIGAGWQYRDDDFMFALNGYLGFYYIEIDDDTPGARGYSRNELDNGEASNVFEAELAYKITPAWSSYANLKRYSANAGFSELETDLKLLVSYHDAISFLAKGSSLNLQIKYNSYNFKEFNIHPLTVLPWDSDSIVELYIKTPLYTLK